MSVATALCLTLIPATDADAASDGIQVFRQSYLTAPTADQNVEVTVSLYGPTFRAETDLDGTWQANGAAWLGGQISWSDTNLATGQTTQRNFPVYINQLADKVTFYGKSGGKWQFEDLTDMPMWIMNALKSRDKASLESNLSAVREVKILDDKDNKQQMAVFLDGKKVAALVRNSGGNDKQFAEYLARAMEKTNLECVWVVDKDTKQTVTLNADLTTLMRNYAKEVLEGSYHSELTLTPEEIDFYKTIGYYCNLNFYVSSLGTLQRDKFQKAYNLGKEAQNAATAGNMLEELRAEAVASTVKQ